MRHTLSLGQRQIPKIAVFILPISLILLADSIMSYLFPVFTEKTLTSNTQMGLVMGFSSLVGFLFDLITPKIFSKRSWGLMITCTIVSAIFFPLSTYIGIQTSHIAWFFFAAAIWGVYFEFLFFSAQDFIVSEEPKRFFQKDQGLLSSIWQLTSIIGPIIGGLLLSTSLTQFVVVVITLQLVAYGIYIIFFPHETYKEVQRERNNTNTPSLSLKDTINHMHGYLTRLLPLVILGFSNSFISSFFFTVGGLFGMQVATSILPDWFLLITFSFFGIIATLLGPHLPLQTSKHFLAIRFLGLSGLLLLCFGLVHDSLVIYSLTALLGFFLLSSYFIVDITYEEISRLAGKDELYIFSIARVATSVAFILGPILAGYTSDLLGYQYAASVFGGIILCITIILFRITPSSFSLKTNI